MQHAPLSAITTQHQGLCHSSGSMLIVESKHNKNTSQWTYIKCCYCFVNFSNSNLRRETHRQQPCHAHSVTLFESLSALMVDGYICINSADRLSVTLLLFGGNCIWSEFWRNRRTRFWNGKDNPRRVCLWRSPTRRFKPFTSLLNL